jgi:hypothetical protein
MPCWSPFTRAEWVSLGQLPVGVNVIGTFKKIKSLKMTMNKISEVLRVSTELVRRLEFIRTMHGCITRHRKNRVVTTRRSTARRDTG